MKFVKSTNFRRHVAFLEQTHAVRGFQNMTLLSASCSTRSLCTSSSDEPNLLQLDESSPDNWAISKLILNAFKTLLQFQQEALNDVIFSNPLTACVCSRKTTWRRKFVDFMNFNERFLLNYNELDFQTSEVT